MLLVPVQSSNLAAMGYDPALGELQVQFRNGRVYSYPGVPAEIYAGLVNAPSKGAYFAQYIRRTYPYTEIGAMQLATPTENVGGTIGQVAQQAPAAGVLNTIEEFEGLL